jgi:alpha-L-fucosidase
MGYFVLTTKHHDGFAMFDSDASDYNIVDATPFDRDTFGELATAFRKRGLRVGAYYSQDIDWSRPHGQILSTYNTWDFPATDRDDSIFDQYLHSKSLPQVEELCTHYGDIDVFWFDVPRTVDKERGKLFHDLVRKCQPDAVINGRIAVPQGLYADYLVPGDNGYYTSPQSFDWECCATMNESWGYTRHAKTYKSADDLILVLAKTVSSGGNLLLNIGPKPDGTLPPDQVEILKAIAVWMKDNREAVKGTRANPFDEFFPWGLCTVRDRQIYLYVTDWNNGSTIILPRLRNRIATVELLGDPKRKLDWKKEGTDLLITLNGAPLHSSASVIKVTCEGQALEIEPVQLAESDGEILLETRYAKSRGQRMSVLRHSIQDGAAVAEVGGGHPSERIIWDFCVDQPGRFQVTAECLEPDVNNFKRRTVYLSSEPGKEVATEILADRLSEGELACGVIAFMDSGPVQLSLRVEGGKGNPLYLKALHLRRQ